MKANTTTRLTSFIVLLPVFLCWLLLSGAGVAGSEPEPEPNRFSKVVLAENFDEPMAMAFLPGSKVLIIERKGAIKIYYPKQRSVKKIASIPVNTSLQRKDGKAMPLEEGLMGVTIDPDFEKNHWVYLYHADPARPVHILSRWTLINDQLVPASKKVILEVPIRRDAFKCTGGSMAFDKNRNLYLAVGTNTINTKPDTVRAPDGNFIINTTETESAGNTNDLRGKILRIRVNADGSYSIPDGNLFPKGTDSTRAEIYIMGTRNPWRISVDSKTGYLYWADPGRDDNDLDKENIKGIDEFNIARKPGNYGWPFFVGHNRPYYAVPDSLRKGPALSTETHPKNFSHHNTGKTDLPALDTPVIWYKYGLSELYPVLGNGGRSAVGGPVFRRADFPKAIRPFPAYYEGKWFITDFVRGWIMTATIDDEGNLKSIDPFLPNDNFSSVLDMNFSPDGDLYILEYGTKWYSGNANSRLVKIEYQGANRKPEVRISADKTKGSLPMKVQLSSAGTRDYDGDGLSYEWIVSGNPMKKVLTTANPSVTLNKPGKYQVKLTVTDSKGARSSASMVLEAGNEQPLIHFNFRNPNQTFFFEEDTLQYTVQVSDKEDGSLANGGIKASQVYASIDYSPLPYNQLNNSLLNPKMDLFAGISTGKILVQQQDCKSCHLMKERSAGPSYTSIAVKYRNNAKAPDLLSDKIIKGGGGVWGETAMSAHPQISKIEAKAMAEYILTIGQPQKMKKLPLSGTYSLRPPADQSPYGSFVLSAGYRDRGNTAMHPQTGQFIQILRYPVLYPRNAEFMKGVRLVTTPSREFLVEGDGSYFGFQSIDLTGIDTVRLVLFAEKWKGVAGGYVECYLDSLNGPMIGKSDWVKVVDSRTRAKESFILTDRQINGKHDIYFVFKNPDAPSHQLLMEVYAIEFNRSKKKVTEIAVNK